MAGEPSFNSDPAAVPNQGDQPGTGQGASFQQGVDDSPNSAAGDGNVEVAGLQKRVNDGQDFISQLKTEKQDLQAQLDAANAKLGESTNVKELLEELRANKGGEGDTLNVDEITNNILNKVGEKLDQKDLAKAQGDNWKQVTSALTKQFGKDVDTEVAKVAKENDMTLNEAVAMAKTKPSVFMKLFNLQAPTSINPSKGDVSTVNFQANNGDNTPEVKDMTKMRSTKEKVNYVNSRLVAAGIAPLC